MPRLIDADMFEAVTTKIPDGMDAESYMAGMDFVLNKIDDAPTIEPERKKGEWIEDGYNHYKAVCSECGEPCATYVMDAPRDRFCKWCGADMRGDSDG